MKKNGKSLFKLTLLSLLISSISISCNDAIRNLEPDEIVAVDSLHLIPYPQEVEITEGFFELNNSAEIQADELLENEAKYLRTLFNAQLNKPIVASDKDLPNPWPIIRLNKKVFDHKKAEYYELLISPESIDITSATREGIMRGIQTLRQLFVTAFSSNEKRDNWYLPCLSIKDEPQFNHRGLLLDVCRHFFSKEVILKYIDALAFYKMNTLHLHLTEDQGWRMPIEKYPLLNEISAWRLDSTGQKYGGYYTKEELKEIVAYAQERHITVIPEIELPGHSQAALAAYPEFSCNGGPIEVANDWGVFKEIYCAGNDSTFEFLEDVLTEVMEIFPSEYIHIGGDEAPKFRWEHCPKCQKRMREEGLKDEHELQSYFIQRIEKFLNANNRKLIGWDEILEGGLSENATVQSWRGMDGGKTAAEEKHDVIMSPTSHCYLDYALSSIDLKKIYEFDPIPEDLDQAYHQYIIGGECNMWTERVPNKNNLDSKVFPRMIGLSEVLWTYPKARDFDAFYQRLQIHYPYLENFQINYGLETIGSFIEQDFSNEVIQIQLVQNLPDLTLEYRWDSADYHPYQTPLFLAQTGKLEVQALKNGKPYGEPVTQLFEHHKGLNQNVNYACTYNQWYPANEEKALVDGKIGTIDFRDGNWQGFWGQDIEIVVDMSAVTSIKSITTHYYQYANSWIFQPKQVSYEVSNDSINWQMVYAEQETSVDLTNKQSIATFNFLDSSDGGDVLKGRYIRLKALSIGKVPEGHEAAGQEAWLFIDEISIN